MGHGPAGYRDTPHPLIALALALAAGFLGGRLGERHHRDHDATVSLVEARRGVREHQGGILHGRRS